MKLKGMLTIQIVGAGDVKELEEQKKFASSGMGSKYAKLCN